MSKKRSLVILLAIGAYLHARGVHGYQGVCRTSSGPVQTVHYM